MNSIGGRRSVAWLTFARCMQWAAVCVGCGLAPLALAEMPDFTLPAGSVKGERLLPFQVNGRQTVLQDFVVPQSVAAATAKLVAQIHGSPVLLGLADGVAISWSEKSWLWSVRLRGLGPDRTQGTLSGSDMAEGALTTSRRPGWLPAQARLALDVSTRQAGSSATQQVYLHTATPDAFSRLISAALKRCGWQSVSESNGAAHWERAGARLDLVLVPAAGGSGLVVHLVEPPRHVRRSTPC